MVRGAARAQLVDPGREELLAGAGLAEEQHRGVGGGDAFDLCEHRADRLALADDRVEAAALVDLAFQRDVLQVELVAQPHDFLERLLLLGDVQAGPEVAGELAAGEVRGAVVEDPAPGPVAPAQPIFHR